MKTHHIAYSDILDILQTHDDAVVFVTQLGHVIDSLYGDQKPVADIFTQQIAFDKKEKLISLLTKNEIDMTNTVEVQKFLADLQSSIQEIPVATLFLAFEPKREFIVSLSSWLVVHLQKAVLLDILCDVRLVGGIIIEYKGLRKDYSLRKILEEKYERGEIRTQLAQ